MIEEPPGDDIEFSTGTGTGPAVVYPLVGDTGNRRVLEEWLTDHESYRLASTGDPIVESDCDLCVVDQTGFKQDRRALVTAKKNTAPVLLPVLLLVSEWESTVVSQDRGEIADTVFVGTVDEIVSTPIRQIELEWRMEALLRLREQSLELRAKQERLRVFRRAAEAAGHAIYITDGDGVIEYVNPAFEEITGYSREEALGNTLEMLNSGAMPSGFFDDLWETVSEGSVWEGELVDRRKNGTEYVAYQTIAPIIENGESTAFVAVQTDITERTEMKRKLERHRDIVERLDDPIMLQDRDGRFELLNEAVADYAGVPVEELRGEDEFVFMDEETAARIDRRKAEVLETGEPVEYGVRPTFPNTGGESAFSTTRYPYYNRDDELVGTVAICRNVTDLEERTRQLRVIDTVLRHNLRNSLTVVRLLAEQLRAETEGELSATADRIVETASDLRETGDKSRAITSVLAEASKREPIDIARVVRSVTDAVAADRPEVDIVLNSPGRAMVSAISEIGEALEELVRNALEHSDRDTPTVETQVAVGEQVTVTVTDDGPGMAEMDRDVLETGVATDDLYHGSGLGLWLVYWIVERSNGSVTVCDADPRGTSVTVTVPRYTGEVD